MSDPNDLLSSFDPGPAMNPLPPSDVRRQGDRLRRRNTVFAGVGAAVAVALIATPIAILGSRDGGDTQPDPAPPLPSCSTQGCEDFRDALALVPGGATYVSYVNRDLGAERLGIDDIGHDATDQEVNRYFEAIVEEPSIVSSNFVSYLTEMHEKAAFSELDIDWELKTGKADGLSGITVLRMDDRLDLDAVADDLVDAGYDEVDRDGRRHFTIEPASSSKVGGDGMVSDRYPVSTMHEVTVVPERHLMVLNGDSSVPLDGAVSALESGTFDGLLDTAGTPERAELRVSPDCSLAAGGQLTPELAASNGIDQLGTPEATAFYVTADTAETHSVLEFLDEQAARSDLEARTTYLNQGDYILTGEPMADIATWTIRRTSRNVVLAYAYDDTRLASDGAGALDGFHACIPPDEDAQGDPEPSPDDQAAVDSIPLEDNLVVDEGDGTSGQSPDSDGLVLSGDFCGSSVWPAGGSTARTALRVEGSEYQRARELVTFASADDAVTVLDDLRAALAECPEVPGDTRAGDQMYRVQDVDSGYDDVTFSFNYREGLGGEIYQFVRVGRAVLAVSVSDEFSPETIDQGAKDLNSENQALTSQMCEFTEAGCG